MKLYGSLDNYIAMLRAACGLTQEELAVLIGVESGASVNRYESGRSPELRKLIALEMVFDEPLQQVFGGIADDVRSRVAERARMLLEGQHEKPTALNAEKLRTLVRLAHLDEEPFTPWESAA